MIIPGNKKGQVQNKHRVGPQSSFNKVRGDRAGTDIRDDLREPYQGEEKHAHGWCSRISLQGRCDHILVRRHQAAGQGVEREAQNEHIGLEYSAQTGYSHEC